MVRAIVRMKKGAQEWGKNKKLKEALEAKYAEIAKANKLLASKEAVEKKEARRIAEDKEMKLKVAQKVEAIKRVASLRTTTTTTTTTVRRSPQKRKAGH